MMTVIRKPRAVSALSSPVKLYSSNKIDNGHGWALSGRTVCQH